MNKYITEFIGTFFLVFTIGLIGAVPIAPLAIGSVLMAMVYMGGPISGAHYNPAVSIAILLRGEWEAKEFVPYLVSQLLGALAAAGNSYYGLAIGFTITAAAFAGGPVSGGAFNPAVGIGPTILHAIFGKGTWNHLWIFLVGPILGAILAAVVYRMQHGSAKIVPSTTDNT